MSASTIALSVSVIAADRLFREPEPAALPRGWHPCHRCSLAVPVRETVCSLCLWETWVDQSGGLALRPVRQAHDRTAPTCPLLRPSLYPPGQVRALGGRGAALQGGQVGNGGRCRIGQSQSSHTHHKPHTAWSQSGSWSTRHRSPCIATQVAPARPAATPTPGADHRE
jgi:hypothetical protein